MYPSHCWATLDTLGGNHTAHHHSLTAMHASQHVPTKSKVSEQEDFLGAAVTLNVDSIDFAISEATAREQTYLVAMDPVPPPGSDAAAALMEAGFHAATEDTPEAVAVALHACAGAVCKRL